MLALEPVLKSADRFAEIRAEVPDLERLRDEYAAIGEVIDQADDVAQALVAIGRWDASRRSALTWVHLTELRFRQDTTRADYRADADLLTALQPKLDALDIAIKRKILTSPLRARLAQALGEHAFALWETDVQAFDPALEPLSAEESARRNDYLELLGSAVLEFRGDRHSLSTIAKYAEHPDRGLRRDATSCKWDFYSRNGERLDGLYDDLVRTRDAMARELGLRNFVELGYLRMNRTDYGPTDVARYRESIVRDVLPLAQRIVDEEVRELGIDQLRIWDEHLFTAAGPPKPPQTDAAMLSAAQQAFDGLGSGVGAFAAMMRERELLDLRSRDGKAGGGFCTSFPEYGLPYVFANFNGATTDVTVLLHETGHAFQVYSSRTIPLADLVWPTHEGAEIHSMSLEFLAWPQLEGFFGSDAERFRRHHLKSTVLLFPYVAAVDHFQHLVYERPGATPAQRRAFWREVEALYLPWRNNGEIEHLEAGGFWQQQRHIYLFPFYYIDYALAMCCALQFWAQSLDDHAAAMHDYTRLCKRGGEAPFQTLVRSAALRSPFEDGVLAGVMQRAEQYLF